MAIQKRQKMILNFNSDFQSKNIKYAVFLGRFQPFLQKTHFDYCLKNILRCGLKPILIFGSGDELRDQVPFGPGPRNLINNPLNNEQRIGQFGYIKCTLTDEYEDKIDFAGFLNDKFDNDIWFNSLIKHLEEYFNNLDNNDSIENTVFFRVGKEADTQKDTRLNPPSLSHFDEMIQASQFAGILSPKADSDLLNISATKYRKMNVLSTQFKESVVASDYIKDLVVEARRSNEWGEHFNKIKLDLTMLDLALYRFYNETNLSGQDILNSSIKSLDDLETFLTNLLIK